MLHEDRCDAGWGHERRSLATVRQQGRGDMEALSAGLEEVVVGGTKAYTYFQVGR